MSLAFFQGTPRASTLAATDGTGIAALTEKTILVAILALVVALILVGLRRPAVAAGGRSWLDYGNFFIVAIGIVAVLVAFLVAMLFSMDTDLFQDSNQVLAILTALFGVIGTLVGTFFGVKAGSDAAPGAHDLASSAMVTGTTQLAVVSVEPPQGATGVPAATLVTATFSKDMNPTTNTFRLAVRDTGALVPGGRVRYDPLTRKAIFTLVLL